MNPLIIVATLGIVVGLVIGIAVYFTVPMDMRAKVERLCLRYGSIASALMIVPLFILGASAILAPVVVALGLIAVIPLVVGIVLYVARRTASGV